MNLNKPEYSKLDPEHLKRLQWVIDNTGEVVPWSDLNRKDFLIAIVPKGIYKPKWTDYALSVKQIINSPYADRTPIEHSDGSWTYYYYQEGHEPNERDNYATNRGLMKCIEDSTPVAVVIQKTKKPQQVTYFVKGIGLVSEWKDGYFKIDGFNQHGELKQTNTDGRLHEDVETIENDIPDYDPSSDKDGREKTLRSICQRRGQKKFRADLIRAYGGTCAITGTNIESVLEAAHITPYNGDESNNVQNGILLRADIHTLWDLGLLALDENDYCIILDSSLQGTIYEQFSELKISLPKDEKEWPSKKCLIHHKKEFKL